MLIGVPREIKNHEYRVGLTPGSVRELTGDGHRVLVESTAGAGIGATDEDYLEAGAEISRSAADVFSAAELIVKVKEPQPEECRRLRAGQTLFTYLHLAAAPEQTRLLLDSGATAIAYETVTDARGALPLLAPMSEVAGRLSVQAGARCLEKAQGGGGVLLGGVPGVAPGKVVIIGGGMVGRNAAQIALGFGADVTVCDISVDCLRQVEARFDGRVRCIYPTTERLEQLTATADLVIGAVLVPGAAAPKIVSREMIKAMRPGSVVVDVAIDQGGCMQTSRPTTHDEPTYDVSGVVHYCVTNMPGAVPKTSTAALNNVTLPYVRRLAGAGVRTALDADPGLAAGLNVHAGKVTCQAVADAFGYECEAAAAALAA